jgi:hypothetical protein
MAREILVAVVITALFCATPISCGGAEPERSGLPATQTIASLDAAQQQTLCRWAVAVTGGQVCDDGTELEPFDLAACLAQPVVVPADCTITVEQWEDCRLLVRVCGPSERQIEEACWPLISCQTAG